MESTTVSNWIAVVAVLIAIVGILLPIVFNKRSSQQKDFREKAAPLLEKLLDEINAIEGDSYPFRTINESEINKLIPYIPKRRIPALKGAFHQYLVAHEIAETKHWHDENPSDGSVSFPGSFIIKNPNEVLKKLEPLKKALSR